MNQPREIKIKLFIILEFKIPTKFNGKDVEVEYVANRNLEDLVTPIKVPVLNKMLVEAECPDKERLFLIKGFTEGFDIGYVGPVKRQSNSANIPFTVGNEVELWNKIMKEVRLGRYARPYEKIPYENYIQSPVGLVPKDGGRKTRLIFHLSFDFGEEDVQRSLNFHTPEEVCTVKYKDLDYAVKLSLELLKSAKSQNTETIYYGKTDLTSTFRILPLSPGCYFLLWLKAKDPITGKWWYFCDKCLPFGSSISCALFQKFSNALQYLAEYRSRTPKSISNYLDDFLFMALTKMVCNQLIQTFLDLCQEINCLIADEKTVWSTEIIVFLGILLDGRNHLLALPEEKCDKARKMLQWLIGKRSATIKIFKD